MRAYHRPEGCSPRSLLSRRLAASPAETLRQRLHGRVHLPPASLADYSSARFACPPSREDLRAGFPCALGHPWLVTLAPANWGPVFLRTRDVRHRGYKEYAARTFCLENKLCATCANELEIERQVFSLPTCPDPACDRVEAPSRFNGLRARRPNVFPTPHRTGQPSFICPGASRARDRVPLRRGRAQRSSGPLRAAGRSAPWSRSGGCRDRRVRVPWGRSSS